ncbi:MAG TPA: alpha/beta fold hydrolase [Longimicrobium sp.]
MTGRPGGLGSWVMVPRPAPSARLRLFCFPYAGGGASIFYPWARLLPPEVELCAVQLPGREARLSERPIGDLAELTDRLYDALLPYFDRPFAFFGHSNGGLMAFELARKLRREGRRGPVHLFVSGRPAPQLALDEPPIHSLPEPEFLDALRRFQGTPEEVLQNAEIMQLISPMLRADFALGETYAYREERPLAIPISSYGGRTDDEVSEEQAAAWREQTSAEFHLKMFPGGHFFLNTDRALVLEELSRELRGALARLSGSAAHA